MPACVRCRLLSSLIRYYLFMTRAEIDRQLEDLQRIRYENMQTACDLAERLIAACKRYRYSAPLAGLYLLHADVLYFLARHQEAEEQYALAYNEAQKTGDQQSLGRVIAGQAGLKVYRYDLPAGKELLEQAISIAIATGDIVGQGIAFSALAHVYYLWGLPELAAGYAHDSYELLKGTSYLTYPLFRLGLLSDVAGDIESALRFFLEGLAVAQANNILTGEPAFHGQLGIVYTQIGELDKAREHFQLGIDKAHDVAGVETALNTFILLAQNDIERRDLDAAEAKFKSAIEQSNGLRKRVELWSYQYLAQISELRGNVREAIEIIDRILPGNEENFDQPFVEGAYNIYIRCYSQLEDWKQVSLYEKKYRELQEKTTSAQFKSRLTTAQALISTEREKHEKEIERMKREQLERELSNTTLQLLAQTELLSEFREGILAVVRKVPPTEPISQELRAKLKALPCSSIDWDKFEAQFTAAHPQFRLRLLESYPTLTKMEVRICTLLRMNLTSPDIARLTCLSERNIENHRYRIRKKFDIPKETSIIEFLTSLE